MPHELNFPRVRYTEVPEGMRSHLCDRRFELVFASKQWLESTGNLSEIMSDSVKLLMGAELYLQCLKQHIHISGLSRDDGIICGKFFFHSSVFII